MRKELIASLAVVGTVATVGLFNADSFSSPASFLQLSGPEAAFNHYIAKYGKSYGTKEEYQFRLQQFLESYKLIMTHNAENSADHGFFMGLNQFSDWTDAEFSKMLGAKPVEANTRVAYQTPRNLPASVDWLAAGKVQ